MILWNQKANFVFCSQLSQHFLLLFYFFTVNNPDFKAGVMALANLLQIQRHDDYLVMLKVSFTVFRPCFFLFPPPPPPVVSMCVIACGRQLLRTRTHLGTKEVKFIPYVSFQADKRAQY